MSIDLSSLPAPLPEAKKMKFSLWGILLIVFILLGCIITVTLSFFYKISDTLFILGLSFFPFVSWLFIFLYGVFLYGQRENYIEQWNLCIEERKQKLINYGQRGLSVLGFSLITEQGDIENANAIINNDFLIKSKLHPNSGIVIPHTTLSEFGDTTSNGFDDRLKLIFTRFEKEYKAKFSTMLSQTNLHVRLFIEAEISNDKITALWMMTLGKIISHPVSFEIEDPVNSSTFIETWLDDSEHDDELLLVINTHLFSVPIKNEGEFASMLILAGENVDIESLLPTFNSPLIKVHRSEQKANLTQTIDHALLWGSGDDNYYGGVWYSAVLPDLNTKILNYFNQIQFEAKDYFNIDASIGYAGYCSYWLALALAIDNAFIKKDKQLVMVGKSQLVASVVSCVQENEV
ncbi:hypothetical protein GQ597_09445 [Gilliamella sp. Pra-s65]|uniref:hypothetical protein n=1 Tax=unclassified Gilliamella TaxID=2685620 RepID=UPI0013655432|nr:MULTISPECIES: hypothetical protein [unclassified Gilliamella]MWN90924.1 hypothetical protein [Gilliamella sp. Pra-s65]MWP47851.1 hypothetical protein [Gilliamella sp. Pas-s27]MWP74058.1 hypothetical protein [Gilliamella sp. Pra-s52]